MVGSEVVAALGYLVGLGGHGVRAEAVPKPKVVPAVTGGAAAILLINFRGPVDRSGVLTLTNAGSKAGSKSLSDSASGYSGSVLNPKSVECPTHQLELATLCFLQLPLLRFLVQ